MPGAVKSAKEVHDAIIDAKRPEDVPYLPPEKADEYGMTEEEAVEFGRPEPGWVLTGPRDPAVWKSREGVDRVRQKKRDASRRGCRAPVPANDSNGENFGEGLDNYFLWMPPEYQEQVDAEQERAHREYESKLKPHPANPEAVSSHEELFDRADIERLRQIAQEEFDAHEAAGMVGQNSPTSGMDLEEATDFMVRQHMRSGLTRDQAIQALKDEQAMYRENGAKQEFDDDKWAEFIDRSRVKRGLTFGGINVNFGRNTRETVAERSRAGQAATRTQAQGGK